MTVNLTLPCLTWPSLATPGLTPPRLATPSHGPLAGYPGHRRRIPVPRYDPRHWKNHAMPYLALPRHAAPCLTLPCLGCPSRKDSLEAYNISSLFTLVQIPRSQFSRQHHSARGWPPRSGGTALIGVEPRPTGRAKWGFTRCSRPAKRALEIQHHFPFSFIWVLFGAFLHGRLYLAVHSTVDRPIEFASAVGRDSHHAELAPLVIRKMISRCHDLYLRLYWLSVWVGLPPPVRTPVTAKVLTDQTVAFGTTIHVAATVGAHTNRFFTHFFTFPFTHGMDRSQFRHPLRGDPTVPTLSGWWRHLRPGCGSTST